MTDTAFAVFLLIAQSVAAHPALATVRVPSDGHSEEYRAVVAFELGPIVDAASVAVIGDDGALRYGHRPYAVRPLASITKLATALAMEQDHDGIGGDDPVRIEAQDVPEEGHTVLAPGDRVTRGDLLTLLLVYSDNAAARAIARSTASDPAAFLDRMRAIAREHGLTSVRFVDPAGLSERNVASAVDAARLLDVALRQHGIRRRLALPEATVRVGDRTVRVLATDLIVRDRTPTAFTVLGGKTGYLDEAGYNFVLGASRGSDRVTVAVLGSPSHDDRYRTARILADWALASCARGGSAVCGGL